MLSAGKAVSAPKQYLLFLSAVLGTAAELIDPVWGSSLWAKIPQGAAANWLMLCLSMALIGGSVSRGEWIIFPGAFLTSWICSNKAYGRWLTAASFSEFLSKEALIIAALPLAYCAFSVAMNRSAGLRQMMRNHQKQRAAADLLTIVQVIMLLSAGMLVKYLQ